MDCPTCGRRIAGADINIAHMVATCRSCEEVFSFADRFPAAGSSGSRSGWREKPVPPRPSSLSVDETPARLTMTFSWRSPVLVFLIPFTIAWNGFLVFWYGFSLTQVPLSNPLAWLLLVFPLAHVAVGLALLYSCLTVLFNSTTITVDRQSLRVRHGPIPTTGNIELSVEQLDQLFCRAETTTDSDGDKSTRFSLHVLLKNGLRRDLLTGQVDRDLLRYMEYMIERHLGIQDRPVEGEIGVAGASSPGEPTG
ncbi:MAG: hypothetical protein OZSIB_0039 [Candidatus Ozemobacter sibiricus]|jgi:hypothetical protein|uniref:Uncharacterized protein n=1 Tax=Candidatus Ozemobacter sibiricus TaxID=2268124 RepID=A0A367ZNR4_9BACT|nr:MAG: hypothetical protein OZSIB_0039 [Candidatus Ozemobacter sibiricus]